MTRMADRKMHKLIRNKKLREAALQSGFAGGLVLLAVVLAVTAKDNLAAQGMSSGFGFLDRATGWDVSFSLISHSANDSYSRIVLIGFLNTLLLGAITLVLSTLIGVTIGVMRTVDNRMARLAGTTYVEIFRNVPLILQLFVWYAVLKSLPQPRMALSLGESVFLTGRGAYIPSVNLTATHGALALGAAIAGIATTLWFRRTKRFDRLTSSGKLSGTLLMLLGTGAAVIAILAMGRPSGTAVFDYPVLKGLDFRGGLKISAELTAMILAISIYGGAYIGEIVRAGFSAVPRGQTEAGKAIGLSNWQIFSRIRLPLAIRIVMPTLINQLVWLMKATTLGLAIGFSDFFAVISTSISQSGQTLELIAILMGGFLLVNYLLAWVLNRVNDAIKLKGTQIRM